MNAVMPKRKRENRIIKWAKLGCMAHGQCLMQVLGMLSHFKTIDFRSWVLLICGLSLWIYPRTASAKIRPCRIHKIVHRVDLPGCLPKRLLSLACKGQCHSYTKYSNRVGGYEHFCNCCQSEGRAVRRIRLICVNSQTNRYETRLTQIMLPTGCTCRPCSGTLPVQKATVIASLPTTTEGIRSG